MSRLEEKVESQKKKIDYIGKEKCPQQQQLNETPKSNTCVPDIKTESDTKEQKTNLHLKRKLEKNTKPDTTLESQCEVQATVIAMVRSGIQRVMKNKTASTSVVNSLKLIQMAIMSLVKEEHSTKKMKSEVVIKDEYIEPFIKEEMTEEERSPDPVVNAVDNQHAETSLNQPDMEIVMNEEL